MYRSLSHELDSFILLWLYYEGTKGTGYVGHALYSGVDSAFQWKTAPFFCTFFFWSGLLLSFLNAPLPTTRIPNLLPEKLLWASSNPFKTVESLQAVSTTPSL